MLYSSNISEEMRISAEHRRHLHAAIALRAIPDAGIDLRRDKRSRAYIASNRTPARASLVPTLSGLRAHEMWVMSVELFVRSRYRTAIEPTLKEHERWICELHALRWQDVVHAVCEIFSVSLDDVCGTNRLRPITLARHAAMYLVRQDVERFGRKNSLPKIGRIFGGRDHTTVLHGMRKIEYLLSIDESLRVQIAHVRSLYA